MLINVLGLADVLYKNTPTSVRHITNFLKVSHAVYCLENYLP